MLSERLAAFVQSGVSIMMATQDGDLNPELVRVFGAVVDPDRSLVTLYLVDGLAARTLANLRREPRLAVSFARPTDYETFQLKGRCVGIRPAGSVDRELARRYREEFFRSLLDVGMVRPERWATNPNTAVEMRIESLREQTPGASRGALP